MLFREIVAAYCKNNTKDISKLSVQNAEFHILEQMVHITNIMFLGVDLRIFDPSGEY
jgi:hypothetical protein